MPPQTATLEVDLRRASLRSTLEKLEQTTGLRFALRRARVTAARSQAIIETVGPLPGRQAV